MAYVIDLAEEEDAPDAANAASDVPTTMIRSKADIEAAAQGGSSSLNSAALPSTNDIVINKLTQGPNSIETFWLDLWLEE